MTEGDTRNLSSFIQTLYRIDEPAWAIPGLNQEIVKLAKLKAKQSEPTEQNAVIPQSILFNFIKGIEGLVAEVYRNSKGLLALLRNMAGDYNYGKCHGVQRRDGLNSASFKPTFHEAVKLHGLVRLCGKYNIKSVSNLSKFLRQFMHAVRVQIAIFSGMRHTEIVGLKVGCLKKKNSPFTYYEIHGSHHKSLGQQQNDFWYTDGSVATGIKLCEKISTIVSQVFKFDWEVPLFLLPRYLLRTKTLPTRPMDVIIGSRNNHYDQCISLIGTHGLAIEASHIEELYKIDPFKDWRNDPKYQPGKLWPFRFHQFRRSLALYARQSGLVSLPTLKHQLKHASRAMTLYYGSARGLSSGERHAEHFVHFMKAMEPEANLIAFFNNLVMSKEKTHGVAGKTIRQVAGDDHTLLLERRNFYEKKFKQGLMSYNEMPLGACLNVGPCSKIVGSLAACISCKDAVIKKPNLDIVLKRQKRFVAECKRNGFDDFAYRHELQELEVLTKFKRSISGN